MRPDTRIPFMAMPDAIDALIRLAEAPRERLTRAAYNVQAFNPSAGQIRDAVVAAFPGSDVTWTIDAKRQRIVDSWPEAVDDAAARADWGFAPVVRLRARVCRLPAAPDPAEVRMTRLVRRSMPDVGPRATMEES